MTLPAGGLLLLVACAPTLTPQQEWVMTKLEECRLLVSCLRNSQTREPPTRDGGQRGDRAPFGSA